MKKNFRFYWEKPQPAAEGVKIDVPGFSRDEIKVSVSEGMLTVSAAKKAGKVERGKGFYREERSASSFSKSMTLPRDADRKDFDVEISDGAIVLKRKKKKEAKEAA